MDINYVFIILILMPCMVSMYLMVYLIVEDKNEKNAETERRKVEGEKRPKKTTNFETDVQYLMFLVDYFCKATFSNNLVPYQRNNNNYTMISDDIFDDAVLNTSKQVVQFLSKDYRETLSYYMPNITNFASQLVYNTITKMVLELNKETIKKLSSRQK